MSGQTPPPLPNNGSGATSKAPSDPALTEVISMATDAVKMDQAGRYKEAKQSYMLAAQELIFVCKAQPDPLRRAAYKKRANTYLQRAEAIAGLLRRKKKEARQIRQKQREAVWFLKSIGPHVQLAGPEATTQPTQTFLEGKQILCVFYGAYWSDKCRLFLPQMQKFHALVSQVHADDIAMLFVSQDRTRKDFEALYSVQSWYVTQKN